MDKKLKDALNQDLNVYRLQSREHGADRLARGLGNGKGDGRLVPTFATLMQVLSDDFWGGSASSCYIYYNCSLMDMRNLDNIHSETFVQALRWGRHDIGYLRRHCSDSHLLNREKFWISGPS